LGGALEIKGNDSKQSLAGGMETGPELGARSGAKSSTRRRLLEATIRRTVGSRKKIALTPYQRWKRGQKTGPIGGREVGTLDKVARPPQKWRANGRGRPTRSPKRFPRTLQEGERVAEKGFAHKRRDDTLSRGKNKVHVLLTLGSNRMKRGLNFHLC